MEMSEEFENLSHDQINMVGKDDNTQSIRSSHEYLTQLVGNEIIQLKRNIVAKGLVPLEELFDENDVAQNPKVTPNDAEVED